MARNVWLNRTTLNVVFDASTGRMHKLYPADFPTDDGVPVSNAAWVFDPDFAPVSGVEQKYWKLTGDVLSEMSQPEKDAVDAAEALTENTDARGEAVGAVDARVGIGTQTRALIELLNKRDNYIINRVEELQSALDAVKASTGPADNIRAAIPASWLATSTRPKSEAVQDYKDDINAGNQDV